jgi:hypothetical protein
MGPDIFVPEPGNKIFKGIKDSAYGLGLQEFVWTYLFWTLETQYEKEYRTVHMG